MNYIRKNSTFVLLALFFLMGALVQLKAPLTYMWLQTQAIESMPAQISAIRHSYSQFNEPGSKPGTTRTFWADTYEYEITYKNKSSTAKYYPLLKSKIYYPKFDDTTKLKKLNLQVSDMLSVTLTQNDKIILESLSAYRWNFFSDLFWSVVFVLIAVLSLILGYKNSDH